LKSERRSHEDIICIYHRAIFSLVMPRFRTLDPRRRDHSLSISETRITFRLQRIRVVTGGKKMLELPADNKTYQLLTEWAFQERLCCPFFDIDLRLDREGGPLRLRLTGRPGTKEFIKEEFDLTQSR
jgi:hypothetical protein